MNLFLRIYCIIRGYKLEPGANLQNAFFREADLSGFDLCKANLRGANLYGANLNWYYLPKCKRYQFMYHDYVRKLPGKLREADLSYADLRNSLLRGVDLSYANLSKSNLKNANLIEAILLNANLSGANLREADLREADLRAVDLCGADLGAASLERSVDYHELSYPVTIHIDGRGVVEARSYLEATKLGGAIFDKSTVWPTYFDPEKAGAIKKK
jgi:uncharacterized protein YjbI with pentapeptide repeats